MTAPIAKPLDERSSQILDGIFGVKDSLVEYGPGRCLLPPIFEGVAKDILDAEVRDDDLWFVSFPRTGVLLPAGLSLLLKVVRSVLWVSVLRLISLEIVFI